jgi:hypothetical protein
VNKITRSQARRYRRQHAILFACIPLGLLGGLALSSLLPSAPDWLLFIPAAWLFSFLIVGMLGVWFTERHIMRVIDPDPETRKRVLSLAWFRPIGSLMAVNELLRSAVEE